MCLRLVVKTHGQHSWLNIPASISQCHHVHILKINQDHRVHLVASNREIFGYYQSDPWDLAYGAMTYCHKGILRWKSNIPIITVFFFSSFQHYCNLCKSLNLNLFILQTARKINAYQCPWMHVDQLLYQLLLSQITCCK